MKGRARRKTGSSGIATAEREKKLRRKLHWLFELERRGGSSTIQVGDSGDGRPGRSAGEVGR